jgi:hypothetical protein
LDLRIAEARRKRLAVARRRQAEFEEAISLWFEGDVNTKVERGFAGHGAGGFGRLKSKEVSKSGGNRLTRMTATQWLVPVKGFVVALTACSGTTAFVP